jgi:hypothetical protein
VTVIAETACKIAVVVIVLAELPAAVTTSKGSARPCLVASAAKLTTKLTTIIHTTTNSTTNMHASHSVANARHLSLMADEQRHVSRGPDHVMCHVNVL